MMARLTRCKPSLQPQKSTTAHPQQTQRARSFPENWPRVLQNQCCGDTSGSANLLRMFRLGTFTARRRKSTQRAGGYSPPAFSDCRSRLRERLRSISEGAEPAASASIMLYMSDKGMAATLLLLHVLGCGMEYEAGPARFVDYLLGFQARASSDL